MWIDENRKVHFNIVLLTNPNYRNTSHGTVKMTNDIYVRNRANTLSLFDFHTQSY